MSYPLTETTRRVWNRILQLTQAANSRRNSRKYLFALVGGGHPEEFPTELLIRLKAIADEQWQEIEPYIPQHSTLGLDLRRREWWTELLEPAEMGDRDNERLRRILFNALGQAAHYVISRDDAARLGNIPTQGKEADHQRELKAYLEFVIAKWQGMLHLIRDSAPQSRERKLFYEFIFPKYTGDLSKTRLNRVISEIRRNGELAILGPRLEAVEEALRQAANRFLAHPQGNQIQHEFGLEKALEAIYPYIDSTEAGASVDSFDANGSRENSGGSAEAQENTKQNPEVGEQGREQSQFDGRTAGQGTASEPKIPRRARIAGEQYRQAAEAIGSEPSDEDAYKQLAAAMNQSDEKKELPTFDTWQRNLREYRRLTGQQKRKPRIPPRVGMGSVVSSNQIEPQQLPTRIRPQNFDR